MDMGDLTSGDLNPWARVSHLWLHVKEGGC